METQKPAAIIRRRRKVFLIIMDFRTQKLKISTGFLPSVDLPLG
jgi:hypothetical protein